MYVGGEGRVVLVHVEMILMMGMVVPLAMVMVMRHGMTMITMKMEVDNECAVHLEEFV
jgi:hypothetical protein